MREESIIEIITGMQQTRMMPRRNSVLMKADPDLNRLLTLFSRLKIKTYVLFKSLSIKFIMTDHKSPDRSSQELVIARNSFFGSRPL